jgi:structural maintenance of chromosome 4
VVDTVETAQRCVEHLRANNLGKATFICLDKLAYLQAPMAAGTAAAANTPERVPRLFDLVQCKNDALKPAFYFAMRETLVADNLDQAVRFVVIFTSRLAHLFI